MKLNIKVLRQEVQLTALWDQDRAMAQSNVACHVFHRIPALLTQKRSENIRWECSWNVFMESFLNVI